jgi:hypothetical protein
MYLELRGAWKSRPTGQYDVAQLSHAGIADSGRIFCKSRCLCAGFFRPRVLCVPCGEILFETIIRFRALLICY